MKEPKGHNNRKPDPDELTLQNARFILNRIQIENAILQAKSELLSLENKDLLKKFHTEMNIKNHAFAFIFTSGYMKEYDKYVKSVGDTSEPGGHERCIKWLIMQLPENQN